MIQVTHNMACVRHFLIADDIWPLVSLDEDNRKTFHPKHDSCNVWLVFNDWQGVMMLHRENDVVLNIHPYMPKQYRKDGREMMKQFYQWFLKNIDQKFEKIKCQIPFCRPIVRNFAIKVGFAIEGVEKQSYRKHGQLFDRWVMGITRNKIQGLV